MSVSTTEKQLTGLLSRTLGKLSRRELLSPLLEKLILDANWPEEWALKVHNEERVVDGYFHPSSDALSPELYLYYKFHPDSRLVYERFYPATIMAFQIGSALHSMLQSMLIHLGLTSEEECEVSFVNTERWVSGTVDVRRVQIPNGPCSTTRVQVNSVVA